MWQDDPSLFDPALVPFGALVVGFAPDEDDGDADGAAALEGLPEEIARAVREIRPLFVARVSVDLPIELQVNVDAAGVVHLGTAPPTQHVATSTMPVLHRLRLRLVRTEDHAG